jgi:hypothetical protein
MHANLYKLMKKVHFIFRANRPKHEQNLSYSRESTAGYRFQSSDRKTHSNKRSSFLPRHATGLRASSVSSVHSSIDRASATAVTYARSRRFFADTQLAVGKPASDSETRTGSILSGHRIPICLPIDREQTYGKLGHWTQSVYAGTKWRPCEPGQRGVRGRAERNRVQWHSHLTDSNV